MTFFGETRWQGEVFPIPAVGARIVRRRLDQCNAEIVRNIRDRPRRIVIGRALGPGGISRLYFPVFVYPHLDAALEEFPFKPFGHARVRPASDGNGHRRCDQHRDQLGCLHVGVLFRFQS